GETRNEVTRAISRILSRLYNASPKDLFQYIGGKMGLRGASSRRKAPAASRPAGTGRAGETAESLARRFGVYTTSNLRGISPEAFATSIQSRLGTVDARIEGYSEEE